MDQFETVIAAEPGAFKYFVDRYRLVAGTTPAKDQLLSGVVTGAVDAVMPVAAPQKNIAPAKSDWGKGHGLGWAIILVIAGIATCFAGVYADYGLFAVEGVARRLPH